MEFEWDKSKNLANIKNHEGISFEDATKVFGDIWAIDADDLDHSTADEKRFTIIGLADEQLLRVNLHGDFRRRKERNYSLNFSSQSAVKG